MTWNSAFATHIIAYWNNRFNIHYKYRYWIIIWTVFIKYTCINQYFHISIIKLSIWRPILDQHLGSFFIKLSSIHSSTQVIHIICNSVLSRCHRHIAFRISNVNGRHKTPKLWLNEGHVHLPLLFFTITNLYPRSSECHEGIWHVRHTIDSFHGPRRQTAVNGMKCLTYK